MRPVALLLTLFALLWALPALAQSVVTEDDVNAVAEKMYCPICENEPLDDCRAQTCIDWKNEIRRQLEAGRDADTIINDFVTRYGQHVVGIPQDPGLQALAFVIPLLASLAAVTFGVWTFLQWRRGRPQYQMKNEAPAVSEASQDTDYRNRFERDLNT